MLKLIDEMKTPEGFPMDLLSGEYAKVQDYPNGMKDLMEQKWEAVMGQDNSLKPAFGKLGILDPKIQLELLEESKIEKGEDGIAKIPMTDEALKARRDKDTQDVNMLGLRNQTRWGTKDSPEDEQRQA